MNKTRKTTDRLENEVLAAVIKRLREESGLSQRAVDRKLGKTRGFMHLLEKGNSYPDFPILMDIAKVLGTDIVGLATEVERETEEAYKAAKLRRPYF